MSSEKNTGRRASDVLYDELSASRNSMRRENARLIKAACDLMEKNRIVISVAEVVRRCGTGGPAYTTISNTGSKLGEYVKLRITEQAAGLPRTAEGSSIADGVVDPVLQAQIRDKESAARWLQRENSALRSLLKNLRPGVDIDGAIANARSNGNQLLLSLPSAGDRVANGEDVAIALKKLMDHLVGSRQYVVMRGRLTINKKVVLDSADLLAIRAATRFDESEWNDRYEAQGAGDAQR